MTVLKIPSFVFFLFFCFLLKGQDAYIVKDPDGFFKKAQELAHAGSTEEARLILKPILSKYPNYTDVHTLLAKTYTWDKQYDIARKEFNKIITREKTNEEVWVAAINNEMYASNFATALGLSNKALLYLKNNKALLELKQKANSALRNISPLVGTSLDSTKVESPLNNSISITNSFEIFDVVYNPMYYTTLEFKKEMPSGTFLARANYANKFNTNGLQYEMDFYPKFSKKLFGYLNYGYSNASIFSKHRVGAELFASLPKGVETSLGVKYLDFKTIKANIITASIGLYTGNYYLSLRPYATIIAGSKLGLSGTLSARRYLKDANNYLGVTAGVGYTTEMKQFRDSQETLLAETILYVSSQQLLIDYQFTGKKSPNIYKANLGITRQELIFNPGAFFWSVSAGVKYLVKFK